LVQGKADELGKKADKIVHDNLNLAAEKLLNNH
jgi:hypothetical protein